MKKFLFMGIAALAFVSCNKDMIESSMAPAGYQNDATIANYANAFKATFGVPDPNQTWGFGNPVNPMNAMRRSMASPEVLSISAPYDETWVANYLTTATEPNSTNVNHNNDNGYTASCQWYATSGGKLSKLMNNYDWCTNDGISQAEKDWYTANIKPLMEACGWNWNNNTETAYNILMKLKEYTGDYNYWNLTVNSEGGYVADPDWVTNFKITGTWNGTIAVAASEGSQTPGCERTIVVTGTWNITDDQKIGSLGKIIIADGGTVNVASGKKLNMVNQAQLVVLEGGTLTGDGAVEVNNGNGLGKENYNKGTIDVASFNNNFGRFYNYGDFKVNEYIGGAQESNLYNHHLVSVDHFSGTPNARIYNNCQCYIKNNARLRNYEGVMGSALIVGGELMFSGSADGTSTPTYVSLAAGAMVKCNTLYNNGTSWTGPTSGGYAVLDVEDKITYLNWEQDHPENGGNFENNIYAYAGTWTNVPTGNGKQQTDPSDAENYAQSIASYKFNYISNLTGNGNVKIVEKGNYEVIPASDDFVLGTSGCTPGFKIKEENSLPSLHVMAEDLSVSDASDFDFNDCVIDVFYVDENTVTIKLLAAGGTLPLRINEDNNWEIHKLFDVPVTCMVNTGTKYHTAHAPYSQVDGKAAVELTLTGKTWSSDQSTFATQVRDQVKLEVEKDGAWHELTAGQGQPACKIATSVNIYMKDADWYPEEEYRWPWEKQNIGDLFRSYVANPSVQWYTTK